MIESVQITLKNLPNEPGVYRFYDVNNSLLYIGKAKNLKNRVKSYFQDRDRLIESRGQRIDLMVSQIYRIDYTVVKNEKESLILEANLIHSQQPKYNVNLKDDKSYTYVRITQNDEIPGVFLSRQKYDPRSLYFGPYTKKYGIEQVLRVVRQVFPYCLERKITGKPCQYVGLHQCDGICEGKETRQDYKLKIDQIIKVLSGHTKPVNRYIENKMYEAVKNENYALASLWRDRLKILNETVIDQKVVLNEPLDIDLVSLVLESQGDGQILGSLFYQSIREGKVNNVLNYLMNGIEEIAENSILEDADLPADQNPSLSSNVVEFMSKFVLSFYYKHLDLPDSLYVQVFTRDKLSGVSIQYDISDLEIELLQQLLPHDVKLKVV